MGIHSRVKVAASVTVAAVVASTTFLAAQEINSRGGTSFLLGARAQVQYYTSSADDTPSTFFIRRAWVTMDGRLNSLVSGRVQFNANGGNVWEAWLQLAPSEGFRVQIGQFKRQISQAWLALNADLPIIERDARVPGVDHCAGVGGVCSYGRLTDQLGLDTYEPGILFTGRLANRRLGYRFTLTNGERLNGKDTNSGKSFAGRLSYFLAENTRLSGYFAFDHRMDSQGSTMTAPSYGAEVEVGTWRTGPHLIASLIGGRNWKLSDDADFSAFQLMGFWYLPSEPGGNISGFEPMLRVSWVDSGGMGSDGQNQTGTVITPGFMVYFVGRNGISTNVDIYNSGDRSEWSLKVQAFTFF